MPHQKAAELSAASANARAIANELRPRYESDAEFAAALGMTQSAVNKFRNGRAEVGLRMLLGLARLTGRSLDDVCGLGGGAAPRLDAWEIARLYLGAAATPQGMAMARERGAGKAPTPRDCAARILDAERDLSLAGEDTTHVRARNHG